MMIHMRILLPLLTCAILFAQSDPPKERVDPDTHHRVIRLTDEPGSASLYFNQNGFAPDGEWIYLFRPELIGERRATKAGVAPVSSKRRTHMSKHQYKLEPNVSFSPDSKWVIFRSNMFGPT
jgi:hypothetical protein